ncbi:MAG: YitT family protein [Clostridium sp.]|nr:YitT family protein [Clostridium sp.]
MKYIKNLKIKNILFVIIAGIINAIGVTIFLAPVKLYDSGISGTSMLLSQITPDYLPLSVFLLILNIPIFLFGLKKQGVEFTIYSVIAVAVYSLSAWLITDVLPIDVSIVSPLAGKDLFLCALFGGLISGTGSGIAIRYGGAMDGIEVLAVTFAKRIGITVGTFVMIYNVILYIICGIVIQSWILPLYSIVTYAAALKTVDFIIEGFDRSKSAMIITTKHKEICKQLSATFENGITILEAKGYYSNSDKTMIYFVINRFQVGKMREIVHRIDKNAYISITEVADVFGAKQVKQEANKQQTNTKQTESTEK